MLVMLYQVLQELQEVFPAVESAMKATQYEPNWSTAWQTLGRAQLGLGEVLLVSYACIYPSVLNYVLYFRHKKVLSDRCTWTPVIRK